MVAADAGRQPQRSPLQPLPSVWDLVESDSGNCLGRKCPDYAECFYFGPARRCTGRNILVVNHALFFSDLALRRVGAGLLPDYQAVIFDEAHTLEDVAADHLGLQVSQGGVEYLLNKLSTPRTHKGHARRRSATTRRSRSSDDARQAAERFFAAVRGWQPSRGRGAPAASASRASFRTCCPKS